MTAPDSSVGAVDTARLRAEVIALAMPAIGHSLLRMAVFVGDRVMLSNYSPEAIAAMQVSGPMNWTLMACLGIFVVGTVATVARAHGAGRLEDVRAATTVSLGLGFGLGLLATLLLPLIPAIVLLFRSERVSAEALAGAEVYLSTLIASYPIFLLAVAAAHVMSARGDTRTPFLVGLLTNSLNLILNVFLIFGVGGAPELGVQGAAIATAVARVFEGLLLVGLLVAGPRRVFEGLRGVLTARREALATALATILRLSAPSLLERLVYHSGFLAFAALVTRLGTEAMASNQAVLSVESFCFTTTSSCGVAAAAIVGQRLGAERPEEARQGALEALRLALGLMAAAGVIYLAAARPIAGIFHDDPGLVDLSATILMICVLELPGLAVADVIAQALRGAGDTRSPLLVTMVCAWLIRVLGAWIATRVFDFGLVGIWLVTALEWSVKGAILWLIFRRGRWMTVEVLVDEGAAASPGGQAT